MMGKLSIIVIVHASIDIVCDIADSSYYCISLVQKTKVYSQKIFQALHAYDPTLKICFDNKKFVFCFSGFCSRVGHTHVHVGGSNHLH